MAHLGYPPYMLMISGFDLTGAAASRAYADDGAAMIVPPLVIAIFVGASAVHPCAERVPTYGTVAAPNAFGV